LVDEVARAAFDDRDRETAARASRKLRPAPPKKAQEKKKRRIGEKRVRRFF
jgi:hypothetical protein